MVVKTDGALRVLVLGYLVRGPMGGMAWHYLHYLLGLHRMGHDVWFLEDSYDYESCYDPRTHEINADPTFGLAWGSDVLERIGLGGRLAYWDQHTERWLGPAAPRALELCASADLLINISGYNPIREWTRAVPHRLMLDTDPAFTQVRHLTVPEDAAAARDHTAFASFGERVGTEGCEIPDDGLPWVPTRQPIVMDAWPYVPPPAEPRLTSVMQWKSYAEREYDGVVYGMKNESFKPYFDLPAHAGPVFELASGQGTPRQFLEQRGWGVRDSTQTATDPWAYQRFIRESTGEFSIAKHGYVISRSGWFSERSACYLASGRAVVAQETGFSRVLPTGAGLLAFDDFDTALAGVEAVLADPVGHGRTARELAAECFDHERVLAPLLDHALAPTRQLSSA